MNQRGTQNTAPRTAVIYVRVSSPGQDTDGDGLRSQEAICREYAERRGYKILSVFSDKVTGGISDRPAMERLIAYVKARKDDTIVLIDDLNRFSRDVPGFWPLRTKLQKAGASWKAPRWNSATIRTRSCNRTSS